LPRDGGWNANFEGWLSGFGPVGVAIEEGEDRGYEADPEGTEMEGEGRHFLLGDTNSCFSSLIFYSSKNLGQESTSFIYSLSLPRKLCRPIVSAEPAE
jgi:hypothetical protein